MFFPDDIFKSIIADLLSALHPTIPHIAANKRHSQPYSVEQYPLHHHPTLHKLLHTIQVGARLPYSF